LRPSTRPCSAPQFLANHEFKAGPHLGDGANFDVDCFRHQARWNRAESRIEMHLESTREQCVSIPAAQLSVRFAAFETIHTENSYKYTVESFQALARGSGWLPLQVWSDGNFSVHALRMTEDR